MLISTFLLRERVYNAKFVQIKCLFRKGVQSSSVSLQRRAYDPFFLAVVIKIYSSLGKEPDKKNRLTFWTDIIIIVLKNLRKLTYTAARAYRTT